MLNPPVPQGDTPRVGHGQVLGLLEDHGVADDRHEDMREPGCPLRHGASHARRGGVCAGESGVFVAVRQQVDPPLDDGRRRWSNLITHWC